MRRISARRGSLSGTANSPNLTFSGRFERIECWQHVGEVAAADNDRFVSSCGVQCRA